MSPSAEEMKARFQNRVAPPGPTDEKLAATLGLVPERPANGNGVPAPVTGSTAVAVADPPAAAPEVAAPMGTGPAGAWAREPGGGGVGLEALAALFPAPQALAPVEPGPAPVKIGFPVPVPLMRDVTRLKVELSRHLGRRLSNHEMGTAALSLLPGDPATVAERLRSHSARVGLENEGQSVPSRRLVALVPARAALGMEDLTLALEELLGTRVTKSQLWALAHVLLLERAGR